MTSNTDNQFRQVPNTELLQEIELMDIRVEINGRQQLDNWLTTVSTMPVFDMHWSRQGIQVRDGILIWGDLELSDEDDEDGNPIVIKDTREYVLMDVNWTKIEPEQLKAALEKVSEADQWDINMPMPSGKPREYNLDREGGPWSKPARIYRLHEDDVYAFGVHHCEALQVDKEMDPSEWADAPVVYGVICVTLEAIALAMSGVAKKLRTGEKSTSWESPNYLEAVSAMRTNGRPDIHLAMRNFEGRERKMFLPGLPGTKDAPPAKIFVPTAPTRRVGVRRR